MTQSKPKVYIGCSLTQAPEQFKNDVEGLKDSLRGRYEMLDFIGLIKGTATDVYHWDVHRNVAECDLFVAICDLPSIGLGYELASAIEHFKKPVLAVAHQDEKITRLVLGIDKPGFTFQRYQHISDVTKLIDDKFSTMGATA